MSGMNGAPEPATEFPYPLAADSVGEAVLTREIAANKAEREALARRFGLLSLDRLSASLRIQRLPGKGIIRVSGRFVAKVTQACVVSLEAIPVRLSEEFSLLYDLDPETPEGQEHVIDAEAEDPPEPVGADGIDLGETVVQQFALALDPYPRAPGAKPPTGSEAAIEAARNTDGPFAALKVMKGGK